jgi:hypothetical protein
VGWRGDGWATAGRRLGDGWVTAGWKRARKRGHIEAQNYGMRIFWQWTYVQFNATKGWKSDKRLDDIRCWLFVLEGFVSCIFAALMKDLCADTEENF